MKTVDLLYSSRYKKTKIYERNSKVHFGIFNPPTIKIDGDEKEITIEKQFEGKADLLAYNYYNDRKLFWVILMANKINNPWDLKVGMKIIIPKRENVNKALAEG